MFSVGYSCLIFSKAFASPPPCKPWQILVKQHHVNEHNRDLTTHVNAYNKDSYCRAKFHNSDFWGPKLFLKKSEWKKHELLTVLELLASLPSYLEIEINSFRRQSKSEIDKNPASSNLSDKSITLYDLFFNEKLTPQKLILAHELGHFLFIKLSPDEQQEFVVAAGWRLGNLNLATRKIELIRPAKLLKEDSALEPEEDFANHLEIYYSNPLLIKKHNTNAYNFFIKRFLK